MTELSEWIRMSGNMMMYIAGLAMLAAILFDRSRDEKENFRSGNDQCIASVVSQLADRIGIKSDRSKIR